MERFWLDRLYLEKGRSTTQRKPMLWAGHVGSKAIRLEARALESSLLKEPPCNAHTIPVSIWAENATIKVIFLKSFAGEDNLMFTWKPGFMH